VPVCVRVSVCGVPDVWGGGFGRSVQVFEPVLKQLVPSSSPFLSLHLPLFAFLYSSPFFLLSLFLLRSFSFVLQLISSLLSFCSNLQ
jgi:hypothetical protein